jgi:hypothetical protein
MQTPPLPTKPDVRNGEPAAAESSPARADTRADTQPEPSPPASDRAVDADLLIDIPQLTVEELALELEASLVLNRVKLDAKGVEARLFVKANLDRVVALTQQGSGKKEAASSNRQRRSDTIRARSGLRELLGATRDAYRDLSDKDVQQQLRDVHTSAREAYEHFTTSDEPARERESGGDDEDAREHERRHDGDGGAARRTRHAVTQGVTAAGLTAAGLAGGALLEARTKPSRRLPIPRRRSRVQVIRDEIGKRLP